MCSFISLPQCISAVRGLRKLNGGTGATAYMCICAESFATFATTMCHMFVLLGLILLYYIINNLAVM